MTWLQAAPTITAAFLASFVEFVEAATIVLAVGTVRGWRSALGGAAIAVLVLFAMVLALGPALTHVPQQAMQLVVGLLLLLFGARWLRKAILRTAGIIALHDEDAIFRSETDTLRRAGAVAGRGLDPVAAATAFNRCCWRGPKLRSSSSALAPADPDFCCRLLPGRRLRRCWFSPSPPRSTGRWRGCRRTR